MDAVTPTIDDQPVDALIQRSLGQHRFAGAVSLISLNDRIVHYEAHGLLDLESRRPMIREALFRIMSMTKPLVAAAILMLREEGRLSLGPRAGGPAVQHRRRRT